VALMMHRIHLKVMAMVVETTCVEGRSVRGGGGGGGQGC
jgi:hypothetical protein